MEKVKIALVGAGNIANFHLDSYTRVPNAEIYAICDINETRLNETADKFGIAHRYTSEEAMLADLPEIDAVDVCVWNCNHAPCSILALNAGKHVLVEKPMAYTAAEAEEMKAVAERSGKLLMVGFVLRFSDEAKIAMDFIDKGYLGDIYFSKAHYVRRHGNPGAWFSNKELSGGGPIIDLGVHVIDLTRMLMGNPKPVSVYAASYNKLGARHYLKNDVSWAPKDARPDDVCTVEDFATAMIRYENGAVTQLECSYDINGEDVTKRQLFGTKGGLDLSDGVKIYGEYNDFLADINVDVKHYKNSGNKFDLEMAHFVDCIQNGTPCRACAEDGIVVMKILDAIYESARTGHEVIL